MVKKEKRIEIRTEHKEIRKLTENNVNNFSLKGFNDDFVTNTHMIWNKLNLSKLIYHKAFWMI